MSEIEDKQSLHFKLYKLFSELSFSKKNDMKIRHNLCV